MPESQEWERHWNTVCLGIITVASAAVGAALFTADLAEFGTSYPAWGLIALAMLAYLNVLITGGRAIFSTPEELEEQGNSKRELARTLYSWFITELFAIAGLLISQAFAYFLRPPVVGP